MIPDTSLQGSETLSLIALMAVIVFCCVLVSYSRLPTLIKQLIWAALALRIVGAAARYLILIHVYDRSGDAAVYYNSGLRHAAAFRQLDFSALIEPTLESIQGTLFVRLFSGGVLSFLGPSMFGEFVVFALLGFIGLIGFAVAFYRFLPAASSPRYLYWIWLFPSLWFWPSSVGKEAIIMLGLGLAVAGFIGRKDRINWFLLLGGLFFIVAIRPQLLGIVLVAMLVAQWMSFEGKWTLGKIMQGFLIAALVVMGVRYSSQTIGIEQFDSEGITSYIESSNSRRALGNTYVEASDPSVSGIPKAIFNVVARPLPWESSSPLILLSSIEILALWTLIILRRRQLLNSLRQWRSSRLTRLAVAFVVLYSIALGLMVVNIGIIARQRIFLFPFLFILLEAAPTYYKSVRRRKFEHVSTLDRAYVSQRSSVTDTSVIDCGSLPAGVEAGKELPPT